MNQKYTTKTIDASKSKIMFWGHTNSKPYVTKTCLSQWFPSKFNLNGIDYCCAEQYMMAEKARLANDNETLALILSSTNPREIKALGRSVKNLDLSKWDDIKFDVVVKGNIAKFLQNKDLKEFLLNTKDSILVEASPYDNIWGIGMSFDDKNVNNIELWGTNLLGFALMQVRDIISENM